jgi:hypothetical protein
MRRAELEHILRERVEMLPFDPARRRSIRERLEALA